MIKLVRAGGFAAAMWLCVAAVGAADPLQAEASTVPAVTTSYLDHASAAIDAQGIAPAAPEADTTPPATTPAASSEHAVASVAASMFQFADAVTPTATTLDQLVQAYRAAEVNDREQECLANAVYFEARSEPLAGQLAVAEVVLNRTRSGRYPTGICAVVTQPAQFSFIRAGRFPAADRDSEAWRKAVAISRIALDKLAGDLPQSVLWYHATYVSPSWGKRLRREAKIGLHIFYS